MNDYIWGNEEYLEHELEEIFMEFINDNYGTVELFGIEYDYARVVKDVDPSSFRQSFLNWIDSEGIEEL
jgi:RNA-splicing ligase RtcB